MIAEARFAHGLNRLGAFALVLSIGLAGCDEKQRVTQTSLDRGSATSKQVVGEQLYACEDGSRLVATFIGDGLNLDLTASKTGGVEHLSAPAQGLTYLGDRVAATLAGRTLLIKRLDRHALSCERDR